MLVVLFAVLGPVVERYITQIGPIHIPKAGRSSHYTLLCL